MKKYLLLVLLAFVCLFSLTGCVQYRVIGEWEVTGFEVKGKEYTIKEYVKKELKDSLGSYYDYYSDSEISAMIKAYEKDYTGLTLKFKKDGTGKIAGEKFEWEADGKEISIDWDDDNYLDDFDEAILEGKVLKVEIKKGVYALFTKVDK